MAAICQRHLVVSWGMNRRPIKQDKLLRFCPALYLTANVRALWGLIISPRCLHRELTIALFKTFLS
jgi:hypothetical protein